MMYYIKRAIARVYGLVFSFYHKNRAKRVISKMTRDEKGRWVADIDD